MADKKQVNYGTLMQQPLNRLISIAPMMACTDRHYRYFMRLISRHVLLYTEMITAQAIIHGDVQHLLQYNNCEHPLALQLGGSDPEQLAQCAQIAEDFGYREVNLNVGCPSNRVQAGGFGAWLMKEPQLVADCVAAMQKAVEIPVTVKTRIGVDDADSYELLAHLVSTISQTGCDTFIIHARKAWLKGLSPKQNREIPPLIYDRVYRLKRDFAPLTIVINGGINTFAEIDQHLEKVDGVMLGRVAYYDPYMLAQVDQRYYDDAHPILSREQIAAKMQTYISEQQKQGVQPRNITRHLMGLYLGMPGARAWRRHISETGELLLAL